MLVKEPIIGSMKTKKETKRKKLTQEEVDLISKGIRPEGMDQNTFKDLRRKSNYMDKEYLKGHFSYVSVETVTEKVEVEDKKTGNMTEKLQKVVKTYPVFRRTQPKVLGREGKAR